ncbi:hypothetical protein MD484_g1018, partial [Candolleomyces efflorescens]
MLLPSSVIYHGPFPSTTTSPSPPTSSTTPTLRATSLRVEPEHRATSTTMESKLPTDVLYSIIAEVAGERQSARDLRSVSLASRLLREVTLPVLFANVQWPHGDKHSEENGLEFFPETLWRHFRKLSLLWPDHWPDASPPMWGDRYYIGGDYHPRHLDKLVRALPRMEGLSKFHITCPFYPPVSIFTALVQCPSIRSLSISDTPLYIDMLPRIPSQFNLEHIALVPVAEALRVGEGPYDSKYQEVTYYIRDYRKRYRNDSLARYAADSFLFNLGKADSLRSVQVSGDLCSLSELAQHEWPNLHTLILTGHAPRANPNGTELVDVIAQMPQLIDLRLLFATVKNDPLFRILPANVAGEHSNVLTSSSYAIITGPSGPCYIHRRNPATVLSQIRYLAMSNACQLSGVIFHYANQLERLVICAISDLPRVPVALSRAEINALMRDLGTPAPPSNGDAPNPSSSPSSSTATSSTSSPSSGASTAPAPGSNHQTTGYPSLKLLRIMIEDKANPELCHQISSLFPNLETLEVELCGYHDGKPIYDWDEFAVAFTPLTQLRNLRMCIQFPEFDDADRVEPWRNARREFGWSIGLNGMAMKIR